MIVFIITIVCSGIFGGTVNFFQLYSDENKGWLNYWKCVVIGTGASFLVPLFLQMISSNLVEASKNNEKDLLVFIGFCLIASIFSRRFIETIGERVLKEVQEVKQTAETAKEMAEFNKEEVSLLTSKSTEVDETSKISAEEANSEDPIPAESGNGNLASDEIKDQVIRVMKALKDTLYTFRTLKGIAKDSKITEGIAKKIIDGLKRKEWVKEINKDGKVLYALTDLGNRIKVLKED